MTLAELGVSWTLNGTHRARADYLLARSKLGVFEALDTPDTYGTARETDNTMDTSQKLKSKYPYFNILTSQEI